MARELESERQCSCCQWWRQQGVFVEGEPAGRVGVRQDDGGIESGLHDDAIQRTKHFPGMIVPRVAYLRWGPSLCVSDAALQVCG